MKRSVPCSTVLHHSRSSWAAVVRWSALMPKALTSSRKHLMQSFSWPRTQPAPPPVLRGSRISTVSYPVYTPQIPRTRSVSCIRSPRCFHLPSWWARSDRKTGGRRDCSFANWCSESGSCGGLGAAYCSGTHVGFRWRSRTALSRWPRLLASGFRARGEHSVGRAVGRCTSGSYTMRCVCTSWPRWAGRDCGWCSPRGIWTRFFGCAPDPLSLRWMWRWTLASPSCVNTWYQPWPSIRWGQAPRTRPRSSSSLASRGITRRL